MLLFNMATFVLSHFQCYFAANDLKTYRIVHDTQREETLYIMDTSKLSLIISNISIEKVLPLTNDSIFNPFF